MLWVAVGALVASAPGVQAEEGQQRYTSRTTPHVTCVTRHAQNAKPTSRCRTVAPWSTTVAPWSTTMRRVFHPETNGVKASPHRHKWMLSRGAPADPSDPWNSHAAPVSPRPLAVLHPTHHTNMALLLRFTRGRPPPRQRFLHPLNQRVVMPPRPMLRAPVEAQIS